MALLELDDFLLAWADDQLLYAQTLARYSDLTGPGLEALVAVLSIVQDGFSHADALFQLRHDRVGGPTVDELVFARDPSDFRNSPLSELTGDDWTTLCVQSWLFSMSGHELASAVASNEELPGELRELAAVMQDEAAFHADYWRRWVLNLQGWEETADEVPLAIIQAWPAVTRFFAGPVARFHPRGADAVEQTLFAHGFAIPTMNSDGGPVGSRVDHAEDFERVIEELQCVARQYPGGVW